MSSKIARQIMRIAVIVLLSGAAAQAAVHYVALDGSGADGQSWATAYKSIDAAVRAATTVAGDEIRIKQGTYSLLSTITVGKAVKIFGGYSGYLDDSRDWRTFTTTVDGATRAMHCFDVSANAQFDGLTITRGSAVGSNPNNQGGGMYVHGCRPIVSNCIFHQNYAEYMGGAVSISNAPGTTISGCTFTENTSSELGGAILCRSEITIAACQFQANKTGLDEYDGYGGAIRNESCSPTILSCTFTGDTADYGGAISNHESDAEIESCTFVECGASGVAGGGMHNLGGAPTISKCLFRGNGTTNRGGAVWDASLATYVNCILWDNSAMTYGGAVYVDQSSAESISAAQFLNCTFYANNGFQGGALFSYNAAPVITNCIFWGDTCWDVDPEIHSVTWVIDKTPVVTYCDVNGTDVYPGTGNIREDPLFANADSGDFTLMGTSACVDSGTNDVAGLPTEDYAGNPRLRDGDGDSVPVVDMGARELQGYTLTDHVLRGTILQGIVYDSPSDTTAEHVFMMEFETDADIESITVQTPGGSSCIITSEPHTTSGNVETFCVESGGLYTWQYWASFDSADGLKNYGDGTYAITYRRAGIWPAVFPPPAASYRETQVAYTLPRGGAIPQPTQRPNITWPTSGASVASPVTLTWDACTDAVANTIYLALIHSATDTSVAGDAYLLSVTASGPYTLQEGLCDVELSFANLYDTADSAGIPFEIGRVVMVGDQFNVLHTAVYRFYSPFSGVHFYTISADERDDLIANYSYAWTYEGRAYGTCATASNGDLAPVYRFWSGWSHFYTISEAEKDDLIANFPGVWTYEGVAFYAYPEGSQPPDAKPVYRFWNPYTSSHFYTISEAERDTVINDYGYFWTYEGTAFYAYE